jgi:hypothetical protein
MSEDTPPGNRSRSGAKDATVVEKSLWGLGGFGENMANNALPSLANSIYPRGSSTP